MKKKFQVEIWKWIGQFFVQFLGIIGTLWEKMKLANILSEWDKNAGKGVLGSLRNGPDKNDSNNGNEHVGMQKRC